MNEIMVILTKASIAACCIVLFVWLSDKSKRQQFLVIIFAFLSLITSIMVVTLSGLPASAKCVNNAVPRDASDESLSFCAYMSFSNIYTLTATAIAWTLQSFDVYLKIVWGKKTEHYRNYYLAVIFGLPLITVTLFGATESWG